LGFRKGVLDIMRDVGEAEVNRIMNSFEDARPGFPGANEKFATYQDFKRSVIEDQLEGVKIISIRRPQAMNALTDEIMDEILAILKKYADDPSIKGFVITGYGNAAFSAGADIGRFPTMLGDRDASIQYSKDCARVQLYMDRMDKPVVAAVNGLAFGGGLELAIRCHSIVASGETVFRFPEITLGIAPGIGGCIVPYRKWPKGAKLFHEMICLDRAVTVKEAADIGMVARVTEGYPELIRAAIEEINKLQGNIKRIPDNKVDIPEIPIPDQPVAGRLQLSKEAVSIIAKTIENGAAADSFTDALEIGYKGFGETACTDAAREGISAFMEKRRPEFKK